MKIEYYSDIHNEFRRENLWYPPSYKVEDNSNTILLLVGDVDSNPDRLFSYLEVLGKEYQEVVFIPGNHEYYGNDYTKLSSRFYAGTSEVSDNIHTLDNDYVFFTTTRGKRVLLLGSTLWTDFRQNYVSEMIAKHNIQDFSAIRMGSSRFTPYDCSMLFNKSTEYLTSCINLLHSSVDIVIVATHFPPSDTLAHRGFPSAGPIADYFCPNIDIQMFKRVDYWIYGHTHDSIDTEIYGCKVLSNQIGYPGETYKEGSKFTSKFLYIEE